LKIDEKARIMAWK
jgi:transposase